MLTLFHLETDFVNTCSGIRIGLWIKLFILFSNELVYFKSNKLTKK